MKNNSVTLAAVFALCFLHFGVGESIAADADLRVTAFSIFEPNPIVPGARLTRIGYSLINFGPASIGSFIGSPGRIQLTVFLSPNAIFGDSDDINLGSLTSSVTLPAGSSSENTTSNPNGLPFTAPSTPGSYYAFIRVIPDPTRTIVDPDLSDNVAQYPGQVIVGTVPDPQPFISSITRLTPSTSLTAASSVTYHVAFSETVNGVSISDFVLVAVGGTLSNQVITAVSATSGKEIDVTVNTGTGDGALRLDVLIPGATITDGASQGLSGGFTTGEVYSIDKTPPTITDIVAVTPNPRSSAVTNMVVVFSEVIALSTFTFTDVLLTRNSVPITISNAVFASQTSGTTYRISGLETYTTDEGEYSLTLNASGIQDLAGNAGIGSAAMMWMLARPTLRIVNVENNLVASWESWADGYVLQKALNLSLPFGWSAITNSPVVVGDRKAVTITNDGGDAFLRLEKAP